MNFVALRPLTSGYTVHPHGQLENDFLALKSGKARDNRKIVKK